MYDKINTTEYVGRILACTKPTGKEFLAKLVGLTETHMLFETKSGLIIKNRYCDVATIRVAV